MELKTLQDTDVSGKTVLLRVDYEVPTETKDGKLVVIDDTRIRVSVPTIEYLLEKNCKIILVSKFGRPDGVVDEALRLDPLAAHLSDLLDRPVKKLNELVGDSVREAVSQMQSGDLLMLENTRFHPGETKNDPELARQLASLADIMVNDAFSISHRAHASVAGVAQFLPAVAGLQLQKEVEMLTSLMENPERPFVTIVGGAKISDKVEVIRRLSQIADVVLVGGGVANNFLKAEGIEVYDSYLEDTIVDEEKKGKSFVAVAEELLEDNKREKMMLNGYIPLPRIIYPSDVIAAESVEHADDVEVVDLTTGENHLEGKEHMFLDIGPKTQQLFREIILSARTVFWNGPMGVFEHPAFASGTEAVATAMAKSSATTIVGGGDTLAALKQFGVTDRFDYVSAAGGASLEFLSGEKLPGLEPLWKK